MTKVVLCGVWKFLKHREIVRPILNTINISEIFSSIQGESTFTGMPCTFVRTAGCNLRCSYCDTDYAFDGGHDQSLDDIMARVHAYGNHLVEITGGEPLLQEGVIFLARMLVDEGYQVLVETNGTCDISVLPEKCVRVMDIKCPGSGEEKSFYSDNLKHLSKQDEVKCVVCNKDDFIWAHEVVSRHNLCARCTVTFSPCWGHVSFQELAEWILAVKDPIRLGLQIHKIIWDPSVRGV